ncbi:MAG: hypothetical protein KKA55_08480 [Proteobacteria bacterium]|nr:hypothetical protein [Pseudomonadota bacterium]MBU1595552.1 hypothetical protein [Pseudomonadota bacterium]
MSFQSLAAWRRLSGLLGGCIFLLILAALVDGMISGGLKDPFQHDLLPGQSVKLSKPMPNGAERLEELVLRPSDAKISVRFEELFTGFWMGGTLWRAEATLARDIPVGQYTVTAFHQNGTAVSPPQAFTLRVHPSAQAILDASGSLTTRILGLQPYFLALCLLPLAPLPLAACFWLSRSIARTLRAQRMCEIYRSMTAPAGSPDGPPGGQRIFFCPGQGHGLAPGSVVEVLDEDGQAVLGIADVTETIHEDVTAVLREGLHVRPGALVRLPPAP